MIPATFVEVLKAAEQLQPDEKAQLILRLQVSQTDDEGISRESLIAESKALRAKGVFDTKTSLFGKHTNATKVVMSEEQFHNELYAIATEWEKELDQL